MSRAYLIAAGGTGGHMFPAIALARELLARGDRVAMVTDGRGARFLSDDLPRHLIEAASPSGSFGRRLKAGLSLGRGTARSVRLIDRIRPAAAACFGGYASVPAALAIGLRRLPLLLHEQNAVFGRANRLLARFAGVIALSFATTRFLPATALPIRVTGNPVRPEFTAAATAAGDGRRHLLVIGGSQGARILSDVVPAALASLPDRLKAGLAIAQQCRPEDLARVHEAYAASGLDVELQPFFEDLPRRMAAAALVVARSGASTVSELLATGKPAILVPYRHAADDHQRANAEELAAAGAARMVLETELSPERLAGLLEDLLAEPERLEAMAAAARGMARPQAAAELADALVGLAAREARR